MKNKLYKFFQKYKISITTILIVVILGIVTILLYPQLNNNIKQRNYKDNNYSFKYDSTWKLVKNQKDYIELKHNKNGNIKIYLVELKQENKYLPINDLIEEIIYRLDNTNKQYKLIAQQETKITKQKFPGYKLLYESKNSQTLIYTYKNSDKLIVISYEADNEHFDILLDSVNNIIYNFNYIEANYKPKNYHAIETSKINFSKDKNIDTKINEGTIVDEVINENYIVKFEIPKMFKRNKLDSSSVHYRYEDKNDYNLGLEISVDISHKNIYEYIDKEEKSGLYKKYEYEREDKNNKNFKENLSILNKDKEEYIYKNSYSVKKNVSKDNDEQIMKEIVEIIIPLKQERILIFKISSSGIPITDDLVKSIKIKSVKNCAICSDSKIEGDYIVSTLKRYKTYKNDVIEKVILKIPNKYKELNSSFINVYANREFASDYNKKLKIYGYRVLYSLSPKTADKIIKFENESIGFNEKTEFRFIEDRIINDKSFKIYERNYQDIGGIWFTNIDRIKYDVNEKLLIYEMPNNNGVLYIKIRGNGKKVNDQILSDFTNFTISESNE